MSMMAAKDLPMQHVGEGHVRNVLRLAYGLARGIPLGQSFPHYRVIGHSVNLLPSPPVARTRGIERHLSSNLGARSAQSESHLRNLWIRHYVPVNLGGLFSRNADTPSLWSFLPMVSANSTDREASSTRFTSS